MVNFWKTQLEKSISTSKRRVKFCESHGIGDSVIKEKARLKKIERLLELRNVPA